MNNTKDYINRFHEILSSAYNEKFKTLQDEYAQFEEHCKNFSNYVLQNCQDKFSKLKNDYIENIYIKNIKSHIDREFDNKTFLMLLMAKKL